MGIRKNHVNVQTKRHEQLGLNDDDVLNMYRTMLRARAFDERTSILVRQGKMAFTVSGQGHEGAQVGAVTALETGRDWLLPYYRDIGVLLGMGVDAKQLMLCEFGKADDPNSGGRQMPKHWGNRSLKILSQSSPVATQLPHACGAAWSMRLNKQKGVVWVSFGDGVVSKGDFHEALNFAGIHQLPVIFFCENNYYAISVPFSMQSAVPRVSDRASAYGMPGISVDGNDVFAVYEAQKEAVERGLSGDGPTLIEARTYRFAAHTSTDDDSRYRSAEEVEKHRKEDPVVRMRTYMKQIGLLSDKEEQKLMKEAEEEMLEAARWAEAQPDPDPLTAAQNVYAPADLQGDLYGS